MSVHKRSSGKFEVRWREGGRAGKQRSRSFGRQGDAKAFDAEVQRLAQLGHLRHLDAGKVTLAEFVELWWAEYAVPNLAPRTRDVYKRVWGKHTLPVIGGYRLRDLTPGVVDDFRGRLAKRGVGDATIVKALTMLQAVLSFAVLRGAIPSNPAAQVRKPTQQREREIVLLAPEQVEALRRELPTAGDRTLVAVLAYAGPRPGEALAAEWRHVHKRVIQFPVTKTGKGLRPTKLLAPLAQDLAEYRLAMGRPPERALLFPRRDGQRWRDTDLRNWRRRVFQPAAERAELPAGLRPYDLRHSFVSLLIGEGQTVVEVARQVGHSAQTCLSTYAHVFDSFDPGDRVSAEERIRAAREAGVRHVFATRPGATDA